MTNPVGRPLKFTSVEALQEAIDAFFAHCDANNEPYTITGLALALDTSRKLLCEYENRAEFSNAITKAKTKIENYAEKRLYGTSQVTGPIFALKNFDWRDSQDLNHGGQNGKNPIVTHLAPEEAYKKMLDGNG